VEGVWMTDHDSRARRCLQGRDVDHALELKRVGLHAAKDDPFFLFQ
jgi:hypothetical protein